MMMKIFGAVLIVSGGFLLGKVYSLQEETRLSALKSVFELLIGFQRELRERRQSLEDYLEKCEEPATSILSRQEIKGFSEGDHQRLNDWVEQIRSSTYYESVAATEAYLNDLQQSIVKSEKEVASSGKALPMVTGSIAVITAVMLY